MKFFTLLIRINSIALLFSVSPSINEACKFMKIYQCGKQFRIFLFRFIYTLYQKWKKIYIWTVFHLTFCIFCHLEFK